MKTRILKKGIKRIVHVVAKFLKENLEQGKNNMLVGIRPCSSPKRVTLYRHCDILGECRLEHFPPEKAIPGTDGRGICYLVTDAAIRVYKDE